MSMAHSPKCNHGQKLPRFKLPGCDGLDWHSDRCRGATGLVMVFLANECRFSRAVLPALIEDARLLKLMGIGLVAVNANLEEPGGSESLAAMARISREYGFDFPYLKDQSQQLARALHVACTPDFLGFNANMELQYRGRLDASRHEHKASDSAREMVDAMRQIAISGKGPEIQHPSRGNRLIYKSRLQVV